MTAYATRHDLARYGLAPAALENSTAEQQQSALDAASAIADGYLRSQYSLPLLEWDLDLRRNVSLIAAYDLMSIVGYNPEGDDANFRLRAEDAHRWLKQVSEGVVTLTVHETAPVVTSPAVSTGKPRGW